MYYKNGIFDLKFTMNGELLKYTYIKFQENLNKHMLRI